MSAKNVKTNILHNQLFGMMLVAFGIGALIVMVRYLVVSRAMPVDVMEIRPELLIPGNQ